MATKKKPNRPKNTPPEDDWTDEDRDAYEMLAEQFRQVGLGSLAPLILQYMQQGFGADVVSIMLADTQQYKDRFAGNEEIKRRIQNGEVGLRVLTPGEYLQQEKQYREALSFYGLPKGFYDDPSDFAGWIGKGVSVLEIQERARLAKETVNGSPEIVAALREYYPELGTGDVMAYILDQKRAMPIIEQRVQAANIGAAADFQRLDVGRQRAEELAAYGITADQARQGYSAIAESLPTAEKLAAIDRVEFGQSDLEDEMFKGDAKAAEKRKRLASRERARFSASGGSNQYSFTQDKGDY